MIYGIFALFFIITKKGMLNDVNDEKSLKPGERRDSLLMKVLWN
ncbi:hypothetical protein B4110_0809 [Parageobacillus toebii]|uniref:Uncharacterized protein n=1 Tax=Parageobacillus toebii TaxID=153151 RepID=A0A150MU82_9BACL|nr:hypothetical protein B4110_0809 [Parageobacillus toebii]